MGFYDYCMDSQDLNTDKERGSCRTIWTKHYKYNKYYIYNPSKGVIRRRHKLLYHLCNMNLLRMILF